MSNPLIHHPTIIRAVVVMVCAGIGSFVGCTIGFRRALRIRAASEEWWKERWREMVLDHDRILKQEREEK